MDTLGRIRVGACQPGFSFARGPSNLPSSLEMERTSPSIGPPSTHNAANHTSAPATQRVKPRSTRPLSPDVSLPSISASHWLACHHLLPRHILGLRRRSSQSNRTFIGLSQPMEEARQVMRSPALPLPPISSGNVVPSFTSPMGNRPSFCGG